MGAAEGCGPCDMNVGLLPKDQILKKLAEMGVQ